MNRLDQQQDRPIDRAHVGLTAPEASPTPGAVRRLALAALLICAAGPAEAARVHGAAILEQAKKLDGEKARFRSLRDWDRTLRFFYSVYGKTPGVVFRKTVATPRVKTLHIENTNPGQGWEGINIYETRGKVFIYVIASDEPPAPKAKPKKKRKRGKKKKSR